jgi:CRISPR-associated protein Csx3
MSSFQLSLTGDTLRVGFNRAQSADGDRLVRDANCQLNLMLDQGLIPGGKLLKIDGPQSISVAYLLAHRLAPFYGAIAIFDPKIGQEGYRTYIVAISQGATYKVGDLVEVPATFGDYQRIKVAVCGFPQTGKSCLIEGIKQALMPQLDVPYPLVIRACPDGEGSWHHQAQLNQAALAENTRIQNKGVWNQTFAETAAGWVRSANQVINLIDTGGKISPENRIILAEATHAIVLYKSETERQQWLEFCQSLGLQAIAEVESRLGDLEDEVQWQSQDAEMLLSGIICGLSRQTENLATKAMIQALSQLLVNLVRGD